MHLKSKLTRRNVDPQWRPAANAAAVGMHAVQDDPGRSQSMECGTADAKGCERLRLRHPLTLKRHAETRPLQQQ
jgi:hypothetical protein